MIKSLVRFWLRSLTHLLISTVALALLLATPRPAQAQQEDDEESSVFAQLDYMKVEPEKAGDYVDLEQDLWKAIHEARADDDKILGWQLYAVNYPGGTAHDYNFVTVTFYDSLAHLENPDYQTYAEQALQDTSLEQLPEHTLEVRDLTRSELWVQQDQIDTDPSPPEPPLFLQVDFMKVPPGEASDYLSTEEKVWKPVHKARVEAGAIGSWELWQMALPDGTSQPYNFATLTTFESMAEMENSYPEGVWEEVHPDRSMDEVYGQTLEARDLVQTELWQLVDAVSGEGADNNQ